MYTTSDKFVDEYTRIFRYSDRNNFEKIDAFKDKYRNVDILMIDDIQFLSTAPKGQEEFFNIFNELVEKNETITKEYLNDLVYKSKKLYGGPHKELDEYTKNSWALRSHYYMNFYLFSYAISIAVATSIANKIIKGDKETIDKYIEFLKCGGDKDIKETFEDLGVNLEDKKVYEEAIEFFNSLLDKYEEIAKE